MGKRQLFRVEMTAVAYVKGSIRVEATSQEEAEKLALAKSGDVVWHYQGLDEKEEGNPNVSSVTIEADFV